MKTSKKPDKADSCDFCHRTAKYWVEKNVTVMDLSGEELKDLSDWEDMRLCERCMLEL